MRAVTFSRPGGPAALGVLEPTVPPPGPGEVGIRVAAATVNPTDLSFRGGRQFSSRSWPRWAGVRPSSRAWRWPVSSTRSAKARAGTVGGYAVGLGVF